MAKQKSRNSGPAALPSPFEEARDELFQHIMRCGVVGAAEDDQAEWFQATMQYMTERYPELSEQQVNELKTLGQRFAQPPKRAAEADASAA